MRTNIDIWAVGFMTVVVLAGSLVQDRPAHSVLFPGLASELGWKQAQAEAMANEAVCQVRRAIARELGS